ncbi:MAG: hypothetical protein R2710_26215 [Acidimicrobiales bacterium]
MNVRPRPSWRRVWSARRCLAWLVQARSDTVEFRAALGDRLYGCDECQEVCPPNLGLDRHSPPPPADAAADPWIDIAWCSRPRTSS